MRFKLGGVVALLVSVSVFAYPYSDNKVQSFSKSEQIKAEEVKSEDVICHVAGVTEKGDGHDHLAMSSQDQTVANMAQQGQDQGQPSQTPSPGLGGQPDDTPTHRKSPGNGCSSVNPKAPNKQRDGVNPNTVGCKCARKCTNGQTQEDLSKDDKGVYVCKNACHKDRCTCPDPCKS